MPCSGTHGTLVMFLIGSRLCAADENLCAHKTRQEDQQCLRDERQSELAQRQCR